jgi:hypothetical protein
VEVVLGDLDVGEEFAPGVAFAEYPRSLPNDLGDDVVFGQFLIEDDSAPVRVHAVTLPGLEAYNPRDIDVAQQWPGKLII